VVCGVWCVVCGVVVGGFDDSRNDGRYVVPIGVG